MMRDVIKAGTLLVIETGEYSDRSWSDPVRVLRDFSKQEVADLYRKKGPRYDGDPPGPSEFLPWLVRKRYVEPVESATSWHVGSYGEFDPS